LSSWDYKHEPLVPSCHGETWIKMEAEGPHSQWKNSVWKLGSLLL
jgi:hypothetical protein